MNPVVQLFDDDGDVFSKNFKIILIFWMINEI